ncbi:MAG: YqgE/AlgH family protein [Planctomycetota bacterium]|nr:MAG: YqgE/AlgH family protein [Planctomycetota bacterium]
MAPAAEGSRAAHGGKEVTVSESKDALGRGMLLIAAPGLMDPNFRRTVVLLCEHTPEGAVGLVLNRETEHTIEEVCRDLPEAAGRTERVHVGGPVQPDHLLVLHRDPQLGGKPIVDGVSLVGDIDVLRRLLTSPPGPDGPRFRCYAGYAGWGEGQLEQEMELGGWILVPGDARLVFDTPTGEIWSEALRKKGGLYTLTAEMPPHPELN